MNYQVTFRKHDEKGTVDFVRRVDADYAANAICAAEKLLKAAHHDWRRYEFINVVRVNEVPA